MLLSLSLSLSLSFSLSLARAPLCNTTSTSVFSAFLSPPPLPFMLLFCYKPCLLPISLSALP